MTILLLSIPAILITGLLRFIEDRARVLYHQERVGLNGKIVIVLKLISMTHNAEKARYSQCAVFSNPCTALVRRIIRKFCLEALPRMLALIDTPQAVLSGKGQYS